MARAPDTLKPYQPTLRNRISTALLGDAKASSVRGRFVKGLMGDTGLSATGLGIVDLLPFLQADEAGRQLATKGQRGAGATNLALSVIPIPAVANKLVKPVVKKATKGVARLIGDVVGEAAPSVSKIADAMEGAPMVAYHGSPKTDLSSVRTSERGALGPGAYFTPNEGVAARYAGPEGKTYAADLSGVFDGMHWPRNSSVNPYQVWRDQVAKLVEADPKRAEEIGAIAAKMQPQDGYPFFKRIAAMYGSEQDAQDLFRKAGFKGVAGHADGPEIAMFDDVPIHAPASAAPIPVPVVGGPPRNAEGFSAPLDMSQEARMARAAEQGFTVPVFHGTPDARDILETGRFQTPRERIGYPTDELWAAKDRKTASSYADPKRAFDYQNAEPATVEAIMRLKNPMEIDAGGGRWRGTLAAVKEAREKGYDGVIVRNVIDDYQGKGKPTTTFAVFDSNGIKLASDPFHPGGEARVGLPRPGDYKVGGSLPPVPVVMPRAASGADIPPVPVTQPKIVAYHGSPHDFDQFSQIGRAHV